MARLSEPPGTHSPPGRRPVVPTRGIALQLAHESRLDLCADPRERRGTTAHTWFAWLLYAGSAGALLAIWGIGVLSRAAGRHEEATGAASLAATSGLLLLALPLFVNFWSLRSMHQDRAERRINLSSTGIRVGVEGLVTEVTWNKITHVHESRHRWVLHVRNSCVVLPKRATPPDRITELGHFLRTAR